MTSFLRLASVRGDGSGMNTDFSLLLLMLLLISLQPLLLRLYDHLFVSLDLSTHERFSLALCNGSEGSPVVN